MGTSYKIIKLRTPVSGIYGYRIDRVIKEDGKAMRIEEYQLCKTIEEAKKAKQKLEEKI